MGARAELVMAFLGDLNTHVQNYAAIQHAFAMGDNLKNNPTLLNQISQTIEMFEDAALERVRQYLETKLKNLSTHRIKFNSPNSKPTEGFL